MRSLEQLDRWIAGRVKGWATKVAGGQETPGLLEIRRDILEDVRDHIEPAGNGRSVFPYNYVLVRLAPSGSGNHLYESALAGDHGLEADLRALLAEAGAFVPPGFSVTIETPSDPAPAWHDSPFRIEYMNRRPAPASASRPSARLIVVKGQCDPTELPIDSDRVNLGRLKEVTSEKDGLRRRNDLAFAANPSIPKNPHTFLTGVLSPVTFGVAREGQEQIATFFASETVPGITPLVIDPDALGLFPVAVYEVPIVLPLPEGLNFIP